MTDSVIDAPAAAFSFSFFKINVADLDRAVAFYTGVLASQSLTRSAPMPSTSGC